MKTGAVRTMQQRIWSRSFSRKPNSVRRFSSISVIDFYRQSSELQIFPRITLACSILSENVYRPWTSLRTALQTNRDIRFILSTPFVVDSTARNKNFQQDEGGVGLSSCDRQPELLKVNLPSTLRKKERQFFGSSKRGPVFLIPTARNTTKIPLFDDITSYIILHDNCPKNSRISPTR